MEIINKINLYFKPKKIKDYTEAIYRARTELMDAERSFNETTDDKYIDAAILNLNLARKKYELCISEAKSSYKAS